jgi:hypothetical protein
MSQIKECTELDVVISILVDVQSNLQDIRTKLEEISNERKKNT